MTSSLTRIFILHAENTFSCRYLIRPEKHFVFLN